jgi:hypothetical protein
MLISAADNWHDASVKHNKFISETVDKFLSKQTRSAGIRMAQEFVDNVYHLLIIGNDAELRQSIKIFTEFRERLISNRPVWTQFIRALRETFNYGRFSIKSGKWNAYDLCKLSRLRTCPYCNHAYAFTLQVFKRGFRPTLDHFYCKKEYPHLALSLNNLIPSCSTCNSSLKGKTDFYLNDHLNPLSDNENLRFSLSHTDGPVDLEKKIRSLPEKILLSLEPIVACPKTSASLNTFLLRERYELLVYEASAFFLAKQDLNEARRSGINHFSKEKEDIILRFDKKNYSQELLGKLYLDLYEQSEKFL